MLGIVEQSLHCVLFLPNAPSSSPSFDMICLQKRCVSVYNQSQLQGCLACYITSAVFSRCLQQAISHSPVGQGLRLWAVLHCSHLQAFCQMTLLGDSPLQWGTAPCHLAGRAPPHKIHLGAVRTSWKRDYTKGDCGDEEGHLVQLKLL